MPKAGTDGDESDEALWAAYREGRADAFATLYDRQAPGIYEYACSRLGDGASAEDVVQESFLRLLDRGTPARLESLRAFLYTIARHLIVDAQRARRGRSLGADLAAPATNLGDRDVLEAVRRAILALPEEQWEVVALKAYAKMTLAEIAGLLAIPPGTAMSRYRYALEKMSQLLSTEVTDVS